MQKVIEVQNLKKTYPSPKIKPLSANWRISGFFNPLLGKNPKAMPGNLAHRECSCKNYSNTSVSKSSAIKIGEPELLPAFGRLQRLVNESFTSLQFDAKLSI